VPSLSGESEEIASRLSSEGEPADPNDPYPAGIKYRFMNLLGGLPSPDPFTVSLAPMVTQYCK
jgi:hypothetical protein